MRAGSGRNSARATASPMSIVPKEVNITIVTLSSTLDDIFGGGSSAASALLAGRGLPADDRVDMHFQRKKQAYASLGAFIYGSLTKWARSLLITVRSRAAAAASLAIERSRGCRGRETGRSHGG